MELPLVAGAVSIIAGGSNVCGLQAASFSLSPAEVQAVSNHSISHSISGLLRAVLDACAQTIQVFRVSSSQVESSLESLSPKSESSRVIVSASPSRVRVVKVIFSASPSRVRVVKIHDSSPTRVESS